MLMRDDSYYGISDEIKCHKSRNIYDFCTRLLEVRESGKHSGAQRYILHKCLLEIRESGKHCDAQGYILHECLLEVRESGKHFAAQGRIFREYGLFSTKNNP